jgi:hypothetical protein
MTIRCWSPVTAATAEDSLTARPSRRPGDRHHTARHVAEWTFDGEQWTADTGLFLNLQSGNQAEVSLTGARFSGWTTGSSGRAPNSNNWQQENGDDNGGGSDGSNGGGMTAAAITQKAAKAAMAATRTATAPAMGTMVAGKTTAMIAATVTPEALAIDLPCTTNTGRRGCPPAATPSSPCSSG